MKIVVGDPNLVPHRDRLEAALPPGSVVHWHDVTSPGRLDDLRDADVFVGGRFTAEMAGAAEKLRLVHAAGAGTDKIAFDALAPGVLVANTFHHEQSIAEYVLAAVLLRRGFLEQEGALREGIWATSVYDRSIPQAKSLQSARVGFVGFGHIGRRSWELIRAFGCTGAAVTGQRQSRRRSAGVGVDGRRRAPRSADDRVGGCGRFCTVDRAHRRHDR